MIAYRTRCLDIVNNVLDDLAQQGLKLPSAAARVGPPVNKHVAAAGSTLLAGGGSSSSSSSSSRTAAPLVATGPCYLASGFKGVVAKPPLRPANLLLPAASTSAASSGNTLLLGRASDGSSSSSSDTTAAALAPATAAVTGAAAPPPRRGPLAFFPGGRNPKPLEPAVPLVLQVRVPTSTCAGRLASLPLGWSLCLWT